MVRQLYLGRFAQADTIIPDPYNPLDYNRYAYSRNNPVNYTDPSGHWPEWFDWIQGAIYQYANDMSMGLIDQIAYSNGVCMDCNVSDAYREGQQAGRIASTTVATVDQITGAAIAGAGAAGIVPTAGGGAACAIVTGGLCALPAGAALLAEGGMVIAGSATAAYGTGIISYAKSNPANGMDQKLHHIFDNPHHKLGDLVNEFGGQEKAYGAVKSEFSKIAGNFSADELKAGIQVTVGDFTITVRGSIVDGDARIGTFFIP